MTLKPHCNDWACPASASCARFFGRAEAYWSMRQDGRPFFKGDRAPGEESCPVYEADRVRPWMVEAYAVQPVSPSWRMPLFVPVGDW